MVSITKENQRKLLQCKEKIRGSHPWLTILLLPGFWACNIVLSQEKKPRFYQNLVGFYQELVGFTFFTRFLLVFSSFYQVLIVTSHGGLDPLITVARSPFYRTFMLPATGRRAGIFVGCHQKQLKNTKLATGQLPGSGFYIGFYRILQDLQVFIQVLIGFSYRVLYVYIGFYRFLYGFFKV